MRILTVVECFGCATCYVVLHAVNWPIVLNLPPHVLNGRVPAPVACVACWAVLVLPLLLVRPRYLAFLGSFGLFAVFSLFVVNSASRATHARAWRERCGACGWRIRSARGHCDPWDRMHPSARRTRHGDAASAAESQGSTACCWCSHSQGV